MMKEEIKSHLTTCIIPFWKNLRDNEHGGFYGYMDYDLNLDKKAVKGCILNSRITWFFANAYMLLKEKSLLEYAEHGYEFMQKYCIDKEKGGIYWSVQYDGTPEDTTKHTYNQAFAIYALSSYYEASGNIEAYESAMALFQLIENRCKDEIGYMEAFDRNFVEIENDKLSENGVLAEKTMNTLLHVFEAYTQLYRVGHDKQVKIRLERALDAIVEKLYNPKLHRLEVFFDKKMNSILDIYSYGHDIEAAWLISRGLDVLDDNKRREKMRSIILELTNQVNKMAFDGHSLASECVNGIVDETRTWWMQAEALVGFLNGYELAPERKEYLDAAQAEWDFIKNHVIDKRPGSEWFRDLTKDGEPIYGRPIVEPWKCPYHNGRMCMEAIKRL